MVALAILHALNSVNNLHRESHGGAIFHQSEKDEPDSAATDLLACLVDRLSLLDPLNSARWVADLLVYGTRRLSSYGFGDRPPLAVHLERECTQLLQRLVSESWSDAMKSELRFVLLSPSLTPHTPALAQVAWDIREAQPERTTEIAQMILEAHEEHIAATLVNNHSLYF